MKNESKKMSKKIASCVSSGKPVKQAVAISYAEKKENKKGKK